MYLGVDPLVELVVVDCGDCETELHSATVPGVTLALH